MTDTSRRTSQVSLNDPELGSFSNVDEIFKKLNISQIQQLTKKYKTVIDSTKTDLHNLVGSKYRDLIKIAEDIDDMYQTSNDIDSRIQQLSYKPTKFVSIYSDNYGKFDTYRRQQNALTTKKETRAIIVRNVINKKLNKLDQKIRSGNSPLIHTSNFIYYAKVYYTIETLFKDIIDKDESIRVFFYQLKNNLNNYLESELSCYNLPESIVHSNDKFKPSQRLNTDDLVMSNAQILLQDDFDIEFEVDDDELDDDNYDGEEAGNAFEVDEIVNSKLESYDRNTSIISNYLISYFILNGGKVSVSSKFVELRIAYINGLLKELRNKSSLDQVNFYQIFKFLEHTCTYVDNYFEKDTSDYYRILSHVTKPWNATTLIGHKVWIEDELIQLDVTTRSNFDHDSKFLELVKLVFDFTIESLPEDNTKFDSLTLTVFVFHNFLVSLKRLQDSAELSGFDSKLVSVMAKTDLLKNLLNKVTSFINASYVKHVSRLTSETDGSLSQLIELKLKSDFEQHSSGMQMFTPDLVNLMDVNTEIYIQILSGDKQVQEGTDAIVGLTEWFKECEKYNRIVKTKSEDSRNSKLDAFKCISHLHTYLQNITWGSFKVEIFDDEFKQLSTIMDDLFWKQISEFHDFISKLGESVSSVEKVVYITGIISQLKSKIANINKDSVSFASNNESIDKLSIVLFEKLVHDTPNIEFFNLIENSILDCINDEGNDISIRPNLKLTSAMYKLANEYLKIAEISNNLDIFSNSEIRDCFITSKNKWIKEELILTRFIQSVEKFLDSRKKENFDDKVSEENLKDDYSEEEEERSKDAALEEEKNDDDSNSNNSNNSNDESSDVNVENKNTDISSISKSVMINGSGTISKSQALAILANYTFLLHFHVAKVQLEDTDFLIQLLKQHYSGDFEKSTLTIVVDGVASFYRSHKNIYSPLSIVE